ncbi:unnamed protein product [marine sediment metagenome]|uniref:DUF5679 domain-containing protein n=1 Tax=marine sediment metagenome TaxID=412755 RepID=X0WJ83_9ZZZZ
MQAYCMKCRAKKEMKDAKAITMKNGRPAGKRITLSRIQKGRTRLWFLAVD